MIVLDTHVLVWWVSNPERLSANARREISRAQRLKQIVVSSISVWEICLLVKKKRLQLTMDLGAWIRVVEQFPFVRFFPVDNEIARHSVDLPGRFHADPADRMIVATARILNAKLVTSDLKIRRYSQVRTVW